LDVAPSTVTSVLDRLVLAGQIIRDRDEKDRRSVVLRLSAAGYETANAILSQDITNMQAMLGALGDEKGEQLTQLLKEVVASLQNTNA
ncbi:MAG: MarR family winged helix-turn-helix transcriptional regulator, partial [Notoacmeibacter sp.]